MAPLQVTHERTYSCAACRTHLATHDQLVSKTFQVLAERAWHAFPPLCTHQGCTCTHMQQSAAVLDASRLAHSIGTGAAGARLPLLGCRERILRPVRIAVCKRCSIEVQSRSAPLAAQSASWVANDRDRAAVLACYACAHYLSVAPMHSSLPRSLIHPSIRSSIHPFAHSPLCSYTPNPTHGSNARAGRSRDVCRCPLDLL